MTTERTIACVIGLPAVPCALLLAMSLSGVAAATTSNLAVSTHARSGHIAPSFAHLGPVTPPVELRASCLGHAPHPISLAEVLYDATRTLDAGGTSLKAIESHYKEFSAQWERAMQPRIERLVAECAAWQQGESPQQSAGSSSRTGGRADDGHVDARLRALRECWNTADALHEALVLKVIDTCLSERASEGARDSLEVNAIAQANFRGRIAHRVAFADGESFLIDRLPMVTTPCVDLAIALAHPRVTQRIPHEHRERLAGMLAAEWPRILREHQTLREIGFRLAGRELEVMAVDATAHPPGFMDETHTDRAEMTAVGEIAKLARGNLAANLAFADRIEREIGIDAADALRVELISNACRDGGFATAIAEPWQRAERELLRRARTDGASPNDEAVRTLREQRHQFVLDCVLQFRRFLAEERAFSSSFDSAIVGSRGQMAMLRGEHPYTEEIVGRFEAAGNTLAASLGREVADALGNQASDDEEWVAGFTVSREDSLDTNSRWVRRASPMLHEIDDAEPAESSDVMDDAGNDSVAFESSDVRRVCAALALDGIAKSPSEIAALLDAFLETDPLVRETLARRRQIPVYPRTAIAPMLARDMPEVIARETVFDANRAEMLEAACAMPVQGVGRAVLRFERMTHFMFEGDPIFGRMLPDSILECATAARLDRDTQRALFVRAQQLLEESEIDDANLADEAKAACVRDAAKEAHIRASTGRAADDDASLMDRVLDAIEVDDEINAFTVRTRRRVVEAFLRASCELSAHGSVEPSVELRQAIQRFQVGWLDRVVWMSFRSTTRALDAIDALRVIAKSTDHDADDVLSKLALCEQAVLDEALQPLRALRALPRSAEHVAQDAVDREAEWTSFWSAIEANDAVIVVASPQPISSFIEGHHMRLLLEAVDGAANEPRLQRVIARDYQYVLGRLRQTPFADVFHP